MSITYCEYMSLVLLTQLVQRMRHITSSSVASLVPPYLPTLFHKGHDIRKKGKKVVERTICVLIFSINFVRNIAILTRSKRDSITNVPRSSHKVFIILVRF